MRDGWTLGGAGGPVNDASRQGDSAFRARPGALASGAMRALLVALLVAAAAPATAQVHVDIRIPLPVSPPLVVVQPGVEVVEGFDDEVFFSGGWFWLRRGPAWYRSRSPGAAFVWVEPRVVPAPLVRLPPGHYRHFRAEERAERRHWKERARAERREEKEDRRAWKEREKAERRREHEERKERRERGRDDRRDDR